MHQNLMMSILEILVTTTELWVIHPCLKGEKVRMIAFPWMPYLHFAPPCKARRRRAAEGKSPSPFRPFIMQEVLQGHCRAACTGNTAEAGVVQEKAGWIRHLEAFFPYSPQLSWSMCYITIICILVYFPRKPLWNTVKLMHITMVALTDNLTITLLHTKSGNPN